MVCLFEQVHDKFIDAVVTNLVARFIDAGVLANFSVFNPARLSQHGEMFLNEDQVKNLEVSFVHYTDRTTFFLAYCLLIIMPINSLSEVHAAYIICRC